MEIVTNKENMINILIKYLSEDFLKNLETVDLDQDEKDANVVLSRKRIKSDAENIATLVFKAFGE